MNIEKECGLELSRMGVSGVVFEPLNEWEGTRKHSGCYAGDFSAGDKAVYFGSLCIDGPVTVVTWEPDKWLYQGCVGDYHLRHGLVPVYSERYPGTRFWWVHPCQLKHVGRAPKSYIYEEIFRSVQKENHERERKRAKAMKYAVASTVLSTASAVLSVTDNPVSGPASEVVAAICLGCLLGTLLIYHLFLRRVDDAIDSRVIFSSNGTAATLTPGSVAKLAQKAALEFSPDLAKNDVRELPNRGSTT